MPPGPADFGGLLRSQQHTQLLPYDEQSVEPRTRRTLPQDADVGLTGVQCHQLLGRGEVPGLHACVRMRLAQLRQRRIEQSRGQFERDPDPQRPATRAGVPGHRAQGLIVPGEYRARLRQQRGSRLGGPYPSAAAHQQLHPELPVTSAHRLGKGRRRGGEREGRREHRGCQSVAVRGTGRLNLPRDDSLHRASFGDQRWVPSTNGAAFLVFCVRGIDPRPSVA